MSKMNVKYMVDMEAECGYFLDDTEMEVQPVRSSRKREMLETWKKQLSIKKFSVEHEDPTIFASSEWQRKPGPDLYYLVYRWSMAIFFFVSLIFSVLDLKHPDQSGGTRAKWLIYLTSWGFTVCTLQAMLSVIMLTHWLIKQRKQNGETVAVEDVPTFKLYKLYWVTYTIATDLALGITIIYWTLIYDENKMSLDAMNIIVHVINSVMMLIDLCLIAHPIKLLHFYWPVLFGGCYVFFSIMYYLAGGTSREGMVYIYPILDWSNPGKSIIVCLLVLIFVICLHSLAYGMYRLRRYVHIKFLILNNKEEEKTKTQPHQESYNNPVMINDVV